MRLDTVTQCHECGLVQRNPPMPPGSEVRCPRCGCTLHRSRTDSLDHTLALTVAGAVLFVIANAFPFLALQMQGGATETTLASGVLALYGQGELQLAALVLFTSILAPGLQLFVLRAVLLPLRLGHMTPGFAVLFRYVKTLTPWGMMDVLLLGILVSVVKLASIAGIVPGVSLFAFVLLVFVRTAAQATLDPDIVWSRVSLPGAVRRVPAPGEGVLACHICELTLPATAPSRGHGHPRCPRCKGVLHRRKPRSIKRTWALLIAAARSAWCPRTYCRSCPSTPG